MNKKVIQITSVFNTKKDAKKVCKTLLKKRVVACGQISTKIQSFYWWNEKIEKNIEYTLVVKTFKNMFNTVVDEIKRLHPYDTPEIIATRVDHVEGKYLNWMGKEIVN